MSSLVNLYNSRPMSVQLECIQIADYLQVYHMDMKDLEKLKTIEEACGNKYLAIKILSRSARRLGEKNAVYHISESKLLEWILTGKCPYTKNELAVRKLISENVDNIYDYLSYVDDEVVCDKVIELYKRSVQKRQLQRCTDKSISPGKQSRINILLRMIWYQFIME